MWFHYSATFLLCDIATQAAAYVVRPQAAARTRAILSRCHEVYKRSTYLGFVLSSSLLSLLLLCLGLASRFRASLAPISTNLALLAASNQPPCSPQSSSQPPPSYPSPLPLSPLLSKRQQSASAATSISTTAPSWSTAGPTAPREAHVARSLSTKTGHQPPQRLIRLLLCRMGATTSGSKAAKSL